LLNFRGTLQVLLLQFVNNTLYRIYFLIEHSSHLRPEIRTPVASGVLQQTVLHTMLKPQRPAKEELPQEWAGRLVTHSHQHVVSFQGYP
jgi:hypothetical protein